MSTLLDPLRLRGGAVLPNRLALAPLTNQQSHPDGTCSDEELAWLERRGRGGFGLVSTCAAHVTEDGQGFDGELGLWGDHQLPGLRRLAAAIKAGGAVPITQPFHGGARAPSRLTGVQPLSASAFVEDKPGFEVPRPATEDDLERIIAAFVRAAERSAEAGFEGVEIHGAHGYVLCQFLSAVQNTRTDRWGGSLENRARLIREVARRTRAALPPPFIVGVRLSPEDIGNARGLDLDESVQVAVWLAEDGVDFVHASLWDAAKNSRKRPDQHPIEPFRKALPPDVALFAAGDVWTREDALRLAARGVDVVSVGRAGILDPDWPRHVMQQGLEPIRPPRTPEQLAEVAISPKLVDYLRRFKTLVVG